MHYKSSHTHPSLPKDIVIYDQIFTSISAFPEHIPCAVLSILIDLIIPTIIGED
jgi:hypothetical protein